MVLEAVRDLAKKKKAADQSKTAGTTRKDAHPGDNRGMMSQNRGKRNGRRSGYTAQRSLPAMLPTQGEDPVGTDRGAPTQTAGSSLGLSEDLFGDTANRSDTNADPSGHTYQESVKLSASMLALPNETAQLMNPSSETRLVVLRP